MSFCTRQRRRKLHHLRLRRDSARWLADGWLERIGSYAHSGRRVPQLIQHFHSPNHSPRPDGATISLLVVHAISMPPGCFSSYYIKRFFLNRLPAKAHPWVAGVADVKVASHFYIRRDGQLWQFVGTENSAWHAGQSCWQGRQNCNDYSIGVELAGCDWLAYTSAQYKTLRRLIRILRVRYPYLRDIVGHSDIAPGRKTDPGERFVWRKLQV